MHRTVHKAENKQHTSKKVRRRKPRATLQNVTCPSFSIQEHKCVRIWENAKLRYTLSGNLRNARFQTPFPKIVAGRSYRSHWKKAKANQISSVSQFTIPARKKDLNLSVSQRSLQRCKVSHPFFDQAPARKVEKSLESCNWYRQLSVREASWGFWGLLTTRESNCTHILITTLWTGV